MEGKKESLDKSEANLENGKEEEIEVEDQQEQEVSDIVEEEEKDSGKSNSLAWKVFLIASAIALALYLIFGSRMKMVAMFVFVMGVNNALKVKFSKKKGYEALLSGG